MTPYVDDIASHVGQHYDIGRPYRVISWLGEPTPGADHLACRRVVMLDPLGVDSPGVEVALALHPRDTPGICRMYFWDDQIWLSSGEIPDDRPFDALFIRVCPYN